MSKTPSGQTPAIAETQSFEENFKKLELFSKELQESRVSIDGLIPRMKEALESIRVCKTVLKTTQHQLREIDQQFKELESSPAEDDMPF